MFAVKEITAYHHMTYDQFISYFLPFENNKYIISNNNNCDICINGIGLDDKKYLKTGQLNILIVNENLSVGRTHYSHYNVYNRYNNNLINIYIYNDITRIVVTNRFIAIPIIYFHVYHYNRFKEYYKNKVTTTSFKNKKFALFTSQNLLNTNKIILVNELSQLGPVDYLTMYNEQVKQKSCYNSLELLNIYNKYKFIIAFENSKTDGYVTEKIFNVLFSKSIPIYDGAPNIHSYINKEVFISYGDNHIDKIKELVNDEEKYNNMLNKNKIAPNYNDENFLKLYLEYMNVFINKNKKNYRKDWNMHDLMINK